MSRFPLRFQLYAIGAILLSAAAMGIGIKGISAGLGVVYVMPRCEVACRSNGSGATDFIIRMGHSVYSSCECENGAHLPSAAGDTTAAISFLVSALIIIVSWWLILSRSLRKAEAARLAQGPAP